MACAVREHQVQGAAHHLAPWKGYDFADPVRPLPARHSEIVVASRYGWILPDETALRIDVSTSVDDGPTTTAGLGWPRARLQ